MSSAGIISAPAAKKTLTITLTSAQDVQYFKVAQLPPSITAVKIKFRPVPSRTQLRYHGLNAKSNRRGCILVPPKRELEHHTVIFRSHAKDIKDMLKLACVSSDHRGSHVVIGHMAPQFECGKTYLDQNKDLVEGLSGGEVLVKHCEELVAAMWFGPGLIALRSYPEGFF